MYWCHKPHTTINILLMLPFPQNSQYFIQLTHTHDLSRFAVFDQFPYTPHIECGVLLKIKSRNINHPLATTWHDRIGYGMIWYDITWCDVRRHMKLFGIISYHIMWYDIQGLMSDDVLNYVGSNETCVSTFGCARTRTDKTRYQHGSQNTRSYAAKNEE